MRLFTLEHSAAAYVADFALHGTAVVLLTAFLAIDGPEAHRLQMAAFVLLGLAGWTFIEYASHRFVLHGLQPFQRWHAQHHQRPMAFIYAPTILIAMVIVTLVFLPSLLLSDLWRGCALTLGVLAGYLAYSVTHHATHHWSAQSTWLRRRQHWHALHHRPVERAGRYGVTTSFWDHVFRTAG